MTATTIRTLESLRLHLQGAIKLEHSTIPPYFCALYSIKARSNAESASVIKSVLVEEMLHIVLAANVLNAIGGAPEIDDPEFLARYPTPLPFSDKSFNVPLARFSPSTIEIFRRIEKPEEGDAPPEADGFETIGQFYRAIEEGLEYLGSTLGEDQVFTGEPDRQITADMLGGVTAERIVAVYDLKSALGAIDEIEEQGEGLKHAEVWDGECDMYHPEREEVAHYFRFTEIVSARSYRQGDTPQSGPSGEPFEVDWEAVYPMRDNPRTEDYEEGSPIRIKMEAFNLVYSDLIRALHLTLNGETEMLDEAFSGMFRIRELALQLMQMPSGDGETTAGPSFEYVAPTE